MSDLRGDWSGQVDAAWRVSPFAVELSALSETELPSLSLYLQAAAGTIPFRYISVHGPSKDRRVDEEDLVGELAQLGRHSNALVMHPDTIESPGLFRVLGDKLLLENMDSRKSYGRTRAELEEVFAELPEAGFCFDIAHAWSIDPGMEVAAELLDSFGDRLRHVHLSSLSADLHHETLTAEDEELFRPVLQRCLDVPWIFEAPPRSA